MARRTDALPDSPVFVATTTLRDSDVDTKTGSTGGAADDACDPLLHIPTETPVVPKVPATLPEVGLRLYSDAPTEADSAAPASADLLRALEARDYDRICTLIAIAPRHLRALVLRLPLLELPTLLNKVNQTTNLGVTLAVACLERELPGDDLLQDIARIVGPTTLYEKAPVPLRTRLDALGLGPDARGVQTATKAARRAQAGVSVDLETWIAASGDEVRQHFTADDLRDVDLEIDLHGQLQGELRYAALEGYACLSNDHAAALKAVLTDGGAEVFEHTLTLLAATMGDRVERTHHLPMSAVAAALPLEHFVTLAAAIVANPVGARAFAFQQKEPAVALQRLAAQPAREIASTFRRTRKRVVDMGSTWSQGTDAVIVANGKWPKASPRTGGVIAAEGALAKQSGVDAALFDPTRRDTLSAEDLSRLSKAMEHEVKDSDPALAKKLTKELRGRQFVDSHDYDRLYTAGAANPEHYYGQANFEAWANAHDYVLRAAIESNGAPLEDGEVLALLEGAHHLACEPFMGPSSRGTTRAMDVDEYERQFVIDPQIEALDPRDWAAEQTGKGFRFLDGLYVTEFMARMDRFVAEHESSIDTVQLSGETYFPFIRIHPYFDGNGRTLRLLPSFLCVRAGLEEPILNVAGEEAIGREHWSEAILEGLRTRLEIVERYWRASR